MPDPTTRILVVDDNKDLTDLVLVLLKEQGFQASAVNDPLQALKRAEEFRPHVIILDFDMPKLLGPELAALLKSGRGLKDVPILFLSGMTGKTHRDLATISGASAYLEKPINSVKLIHAVFSLLKDSAL
jgi:twitching motility two-component system response regulator PilG